MRASKLNNYVRDQALSPRRKGLGIYQKIHGYATTAVRCWKSDPL